MLGSDANPLPCSRQAGKTQKSRLFEEAQPGDCCLLWGTLGALYNLRRRAGAWVGWVGYLWSWDRVEKGGNLGQALKPQLWTILSLLSCRDGSPFERPHISLWYTLQGYLKVGYWQLVRRESWEEDMAMSLHLGTPRWVVPYKWPSKDTF